MKKAEQGFTLMELMIGVAIIGILATVAVASYSSYSIAANRTDARTALQATAGTLEKCKARYGVYNSANCSIINGATIVTNGGLYNISVTSAAASFSLSATPATGSSQLKDTDCTSIVLNNLGQQSGTGTKPSECW